ncbi:MAG: Rne/Rng family ribonuclease [Pirellulales bacterium]|nr:Rne/Rng family ribonuclease [Pirellulales bacterium]
MVFNLFKRKKQKAEQAKAEAEAKQAAEAAEKRPARNKSRDGDGDGDGERRPRRRRGGRGRGGRRPQGDQQRKDRSDNERDGSNEKSDSNRSQGRRRNSGSRSGGGRDDGRRGGGRQGGKQGDGRQGDGRRGSRSRRSGSDRDDRQKGQGGRRRRPSNSDRDDRSEALENKPKVKTEMIINATQSEESRVAIVEDGRLEDLYVERASQENLVGNIYRGKIVNLEPSIQAVFVDFGVGRNGFLHISDVEPQYFRQGGYDPNKPIEEQNEELAARVSNSNNNRRRKQRYSGGRPRVKPPIQELFQKGDEVVVQVIKEGIGTKGPTLTTYLSIPGRYLVLMPHLDRIGVSRKIEDDKDRKRLKEALSELNPPKGLGFIVRTAGQGRSKKELSRDMAYLIRLWKAIARRIKKSGGPSSVYEENDMIIRTIRDVFTGDVDSIYIDSEDAFRRAKEFLKLVMPRYASRLQHYKGDQPIFHNYKLDEEIKNIYKRQVPLKDGGSIVIDPTEALVAIDVNSGNFRLDDNAEETAYHLNLAAAREIARQLRLRDLGGVIVNDFIDMRREKHRRGVERELRNAMRRDRARTKILRTSPFGLIEMTRQRIRPSLKRSVYEDCPSCSGRGLVKTDESMAIEVTRKLMLIAPDKRVKKVTVRVNNKVAEYLNTKKDSEISEIKERSGIEVNVVSVDNTYPEFLEIQCINDKGKAVKTD